MKLEDWRKEIDSIDDKMTTLISERISIARKIGILKTTAGLPIVDLDREAEILRGISANTESGRESESITRIYRHILTESRRIQDKTSRENLSKGVEIR